MPGGATDFIATRSTRSLGFVLLLLDGALIGAVNSNAIAIRPAGVDPPLFVPILLVIVAVNILAAGLIALSINGTSSLAYQPKRRRILALKFAAANALTPGLVLGPFSVVSSFGGPALGGLEDLWQLASDLIGAAAFLLAWRLWRLSLRHEAADAGAVMALDRRPPVLYLRSFLDDTDVVLDDIGITYFRRFMELLEPPTPEQLMARILQRLGPVIAIGKPGEALPHLGAARLYVAHEQWQGRVGELMREASLIVIRVGGSAGVLWEIDQALRGVPRQRLVFAFLGGPVVAPAVVERLSPILGASFEAGLPEPIPRGWRYLFVQWRRLGGLVHFDADGAARAVPIGYWPLAVHEVHTLLRPIAGPFLRAWRRVFSALGLKPQARRDLSFPSGRAALALVGGWLAGMLLTLLYRLMPTL